MNLTTPLAVCPQLENSGRVHTGEKLVITALSFYAEDESGSSRVLSWIKKYFRPSATDAKDVPWCGIFMAQVFGTCGLSAPSVPARASSWAEVGIGIELGSKNFQIGDILVFNRRGGNHVALFIAMQGNTIYCLGGNQGNRVCIAPYPLPRLEYVRRIRLLS